MRCDAPGRDCRSEAVVRHYSCSRQHAGARPPDRATGYARGTTRGIVMKISRRDVLIGGAASLAAVSACARAQQSQEILIGALYPLSGPTAVGGVDARHALETATDVINTSIDLDLPLAKSAGLAGLGGAKVTVLYADHQGDPQKGRAEAERLITQKNVAALVGVYHSSVAATVSQTAERYAIPFMAADVSSPSLHRRGLKYFFRAAAHDEMFSRVMFDLFDDLKRK